VGLLVTDVQYCIDAGELRERSTAPVELYVLWPQGLFGVHP